MGIVSKTTSKSDADILRFGIVRCGSQQSLLAIADIHAFRSMGKSGPKPPFLAHPLARLGATETVIHALRSILQRVKVSGAGKAALGCALLVVLSKG